MKKHDISLFSSWVHGDSEPPEWLFPALAHPSGCRGDRRFLLGLCRSLPFTAEHRHRRRPSPAHACLGSSSQGVLAGGGGRPTSGLWGAGGVPRRGSANNPGLLSDSQREAIFSAAHRPLLRTRKGVFQIRFRVQLPSALRTRQPVLSAFHNASPKGRVRQASRSPQPQSPR